MATGFESGSGIYKSDDEGLTGRSLPAKDYPGDWDRSVAVAPGTRGQRVFAILEAKDRANGLYRSEDRRSDLERSTNDDRIVGYWYMSEIFIDPKNADVVYIPKQSLLSFHGWWKTFTVLKALRAATITTPCGLILQIHNAFSWE